MEDFMDEIDFSEALLEIDYDPYAGAYEMDFEDEFIFED